MGLLRLKWAFCLVPKTTVEDYINTIVSLSVHPSVCIQKGLHVPSTPRVYFINITGDCKPMKLFNFLDNTLKCYEVEERWCMF